MVSTETGIVTFKLAKNIPAITAIISGFNSKPLAIIELIFLIGSVEGQVSQGVVSAKMVGISLFGPYVLAVELASMLLLAGMVGAFHLGRRLLEKRA